MSESRSTIIPGHRYRDAKAAIEWLTTVFGFERKVVFECENGTIAHAELTLGGGMIMLGSQKSDEYEQSYKSPNEIGSVETGTIYMTVENIDAVYQRALAAGATIIRPLKQTANTGRDFGVKDPEGHSWFIGTYNPWAAQV